MLALLDGDIFAYRCAAASEYDTEDIAIWRVRDSIELTLDAVGAEEYQVWLSDKRENNFRYAIYPEYKANRTKPPPIFLDIVKDYLKSEWQANVAEGQEADDALGIEQVKHGNDSVICSIDKDLLQIPGRHYNFVKGESQEVSEIEGIRHFYKQLLIGDTSDNVFGIYGIGPKKASKLLDHVDDPRTMYEVCRGLYGLDDNRLEINAKVLWIRQKENQIWSPPLECTMVQNESGE